MVQIFTDEVKKAVKDNAKKVGNATKTTGLSAIAILAGKIANGADNIAHKAVHGLNNVKQLPAKTK